MNGMKMVGAQNGWVKVEVKGTAAKPYITEVEVATGNCTCNCMQHQIRIRQAATLLNVSPNVKTAVSCKHAQRVAAHSGI